MTKIRNKRSLDFSKVRVVHLHGYKAFYGFYLRVGDRRIFKKGTKEEALYFYQKYFNTGTKLIDHTAPCIASKNNKEDKYLNALKKEKKKILNKIEVIDFVLNKVNRL